MKTLFLALLSLSFVGCDYLEHIESKAAKVNRASKAALALAKENRYLKTDVEELRAKVEGLEAENKYLKLKLDKKGSIGRSLSCLCCTNAIFGKRYG